MRNRQRYTEGKYEKLRAFREASYGSPEGEVWLGRKPRKLKLLDRKVRRAKRRAYNAANPKVRNYQLYALQLENGKYYVGMTSYADAKVRFNQHVEGGKTGAQWTKLHKPITILETRKVGYIKEGDCARLENSMTVEYILKYGIDNVRGGSMCQIKTEYIMKEYARITKKGKPKEVNSVTPSKVYIPAHIRAIMNEEI